MSEYVTEVDIMRPAIPSGLDPVFQYGGLAASGGNWYPARPPRPAPRCQCRLHWWTSYRGKRADGSCIRCGGAT